MNKQSTEQPAILVVDDDMITRKLIRLTLEGKGYLVLDAPDGQTAIDIVANHQPDLVLLDLVLPDMEGLEVAGQIRAAAEKSEMPIILISGFLTKLGQARHSRIDFADYLFKPVEPSRLLQVVQAHLPITSPIRQSLEKETHVLLAHDDPIQLKLLRIHLQQLGFHVATAVDGADALNQARHFSPDAIVSDVLMPHLDGFGLCQAVRADPVLAHIPVILISVACTTQEDHQFAKVVGADSLVRATPDFAEVKRPLLAMLEHKQPDTTRRMVDTDDQDRHEEHVHQFIRRLEHQARLNIHLVERLASMEARLAILAGFADKLTAIFQGNTPSESVLDDLLRHCLDASGTHRGAGYLLEGDGRFCMRAQVGVADSATECLRTLFDRSELLNQVVASEKPFILPSFLFADLAVEPPGWPDPQPMLVIPLRLGSEMLGLLIFAWTEEELDEDWIDFIKALEAQISQTIVLARTLSQLKDNKEQLALTLSREQEARQQAERSAAELAEVNKELETFAYSVSHDLRAPQRRVDGFSRALDEDYSDLLDERGKKYLARVREETERMGQLIESMLGLSRIIRSELHTYEVDLSGMAKQIAEGLQAGDPERNVEFSIEPDLMAKGDHRLLQIVLENTLGNAWKFTAKHPAARIHLGAFDQGAERVYFVRDDGAGFDPAYADKLFRVFQRLHGDDEFAGLGVGLATVQRIIHRHGGRIWAEGAIEQGATVYFTLGGLRSL